MVRRLMNNKVKGGYRHYCAECGAIARTTAFPVYPSYRAFCSKACYKAYHSPIRIAVMAIWLACHILAFAAPFVAAYQVNQRLMETNFGFAAAFATWIITMILVSFPIYKLIDWIERHA
jgi:hypothetical protein